MKYIAQHNRCDCHPETCGCEPYFVADPIGNVYVRVNEYAKAEKIAKALNHYESFKGKSSSLGK